MINKIKKQKAKIFKIGNYIVKLMGVIGCVLAIILTYIDVKTKLKPMKHHLEVFIPKSSINNREFNFNILLSNKGDYDEVISGISCYLVENYNIKDKENHIRIAANEEIFLVSENSNLSLNLVSDIDLNDERFDYIINENIRYTIILYFEVMSYENTFATRKIPVGDILVSKNNMNSRVGDVRFISTNDIIDFSYSKPQIQITSYPRTTEYDIFKLYSLK